MLHNLDIDDLTERERLQLEAWASASTMPDATLRRILIGIVESWRETLSKLPPGAHRPSVWIGFFAGLAAGGKLSLESDQKESP